jgi:hypothetical protein
MGERQGMGEQWHVRRKASKSMRARDVGHLNWVRALFFYDDCLSTSKQCLLLAFLRVWHPPSFPLSCLCMRVRVRFGESRPHAYAGPRPSPPPPPPLHKAPVYIQHLAILRDYRKRSAIRPPEHDAQASPSPPPSPPQ